MHQSVAIVNCAATQLALADTLHAATHACSDGVFCQAARASSRMLLGGTRQARVWWVSQDKKTLSKHAVSALPALFTLAGLCVCVCVYVCACVCVCAWSTSRSPCCVSSSSRNHKLPAPPSAPLGWRLWPPSYSLARNVVQAHMPPRIKKLQTHTLAYL